MAKKGIDVSRYQGNIDWKKVKSIGIDYAMVRAVSSNSGGLYVDPYFHKNVENAQKAGVHVGAYIYTYATTTEAVRKEIKYLLPELAKHDFDMPIAFDMEYEPSIMRLSRDQRTDICITALDMLEDAGYYAMIYCSTDFYLNRLDAKRMGRYDSWIAQYSSKCRVGFTPGIWQYTSNGSVYGVNGRCDMNYFYRDYPSIISGMDKPKTPTPNTLVIGPMSEGDLQAVTRFVHALGNIPIKEGEV